MVLIFIIDVRSLQVWSTKFHSPKDDGNNRTGVQQEASKRAGEKSLSAKNRSMMNS
jgi:hypothetical protein